MVMLGAAIGAPARFLIDQYFRKFTEKPFGTFTVNILGSFLIGLAYSCNWICWRIHNLVNLHYRYLFRIRVKAL